MNDLTEAYEQLSGAFESFREIVRSSDKHLYERWKAGGFIVSEDIMSMYPNITEVYEALNDESEDEEENESNSSR